MCLSIAASSRGGAHLEWELLLVLFNMNKGVDDTVDDFLVWVLARSVTANKDMDGY